MISTMFRKWTYPAAIGLGLMGYALASGMSGTLAVDNRILSYAIRGVVVGLSLIVIARGILRYQRREISLLLFFWMLYTLRVVYEILTYSSAVTFMSNTEFVLFAYGTCLIPAIAAVSITERFAEDLVNTLKLLYVLVFVVTILNTIEVLSMGTENFQLYGRLFSQTLNPIAYGSLGSVLALLSFFVVFNSKLVLIMQLVVVCGLLLGLTALIVSGSKGPMLATLVAVAYFYLLGTTWKNFWKGAIVTTFIVGVTMGILSAVSSLLGVDPLARVLSGLEGDVSTLGRIEMWERGLFQFLESPIFGSGLVELRSGYWPHNLYLESFMATGLIGGAVFIVLGILGLVGAAQIIRHRPDFGWISLLYVQQLVASSTTNSLWAGNQFWVLMGLSLVVGKLAGGSFGVRRYLSSRRSNTLQGAREVTGPRLRGAV